MNVLDLGQSSYWSDEELRPLSWFLLVCMFLRNMDPVGRYVLEVEEQWGHQLPDVILRNHRNLMTGFIGFNEQKVQVSFSC